MLNLVPEPVIEGQFRRFRTGHLQIGATLRQRRRVLHRSRARPSPPRPWSVRILQVTLQLPQHRRRTAFNRPADRSDRQAGADPGQDQLAITNRQEPFGGRLQRQRRHATSIPEPHITLLRRHTRHRSSVLRRGPVPNRSPEHPTHGTGNRNTHHHSKKSECCADLLNPRAETSLQSHYFLMCSRAPELPAGCCCESARGRAATSRRWWARSAYRPGRAWPGGRRVRASRPSRRTG